MKKMLSLFLVLALTASVSAGIIDLQISGVGPVGNVLPITPVTEITIGPSDYVWIDVIYVPQGGAALYSLDSYVMVNGLASISTMAGLTYPTGAWDMAWPQTGGFIDAHGPYVAVTAGLNYPGVAEGICVDHILLHCDGFELDPVTVVPELSDAHGGTLDFDFGVPGIGAGVIIHQIPEPFTMVLLGLGGLAALRRRR